VIESLHRLVLSCVALALTASLFIKGHENPHHGGAVAFLPMETSGQGKKTIRIRGNLKNPGVYQMDCVAGDNTVTIMTLAGIQEDAHEKSLAEHDLHTGDVIEITRKDGQHIEIKKETMTVEERMILGISLDPNRMTSHDWEKLPGIGPVTAKKIIIDRQNNGDFKSVYDLKRISGIGDTKVTNLEQFFK
jgi:competence protein ComEA